MLLDHPHVPAVHLRFKQKSEVLVYACNLLPQRPGLHIAEVGCMRGAPGSFAARVDGGSTAVFARRAALLGWRFTSIEMDRETLEKASHYLQEQGLAAHFVHADGARALKRLPACNLLYLDGHDDPQQALDQLKAAENPELMVIVVDDCCANAFDDPIALGKGSRVIPYAAMWGWNVELCETWFNTMAIMRRE